MVFYTQSKYLCIQFLIIENKLQNEKMIQQLLCLLFNYL